MMSYTKDFQDQVQKSYDGKFRSRNPDGSLPTISFSGANVGGAPNIEIADYWMDLPVGSRASLGSWTTGLYGANTTLDYPVIFQIGSTRGIGSRDTSGDNRLTGFRKNFTLVRDVFAAWQMGIPDGKYFSGATAERTLPPASNLKMGWFSDQPLGSDLNDIVCTSRNSPSTWFVGGNHSGADHYCGGEVNWNKPMSFSLYRKHGANSYTDLGTSIETQTMESGYTVYTKTDEPLLSQRRKLSFTVQNSSVYTITVNGTPVTYTSDADATGSEIATGVASALNSAGLGLFGTATAATVELTPSTGTQPTVTVSANISMTTALDGYQYFSTHWQGNNNQVNTLHVFPYFYIASGSNAGNYIMLANSGNLNSTCTKSIVIPHSSWISNTSCSASPTASMLTGMTHAHLFKDGVKVETKLIY